MKNHHIHNNHHRYVDPAEQSKTKIQSTILFTSYLNCRCFTFTSSTNTLSSSWTNISWSRSTKKKKLKYISNYTHTIVRHQIADYLQGYVIPVVCWNINWWINACKQIVLKVSARIGPYFNKCKVAFPCPSIYGTWKFIFWLLEMKSNKHWWAEKKKIEKKKSNHGSIEWEWTYISTELYEL